jgi:predicted O-methyltransferase YrrM
LVSLALLGLALGVSLALGADALSLLVGAALVAVAFVLVVVAWFRPAQRAARRRRRRDRKAARRARKTERKAARRRATRQEATTRKLVRDSDRRLLVRLESRDWLARELDLPHPLPPTRAYAAAPDLLVELVAAIDRSAPEHVVELGGGISSLVIARRLAQRGGGRLTTLEHLPEYAEATRAELAVYGLAEHARVIEAPLEEIELEGERWPWYELGTDVPERIDLLVVDGPPGTTRPQARYPALPILRERLTPGALVFLDDTDRTQEQEIVRRWVEETEGLEERPLAIARGATLLVYRG